MLEWNAGRIKIRFTFSFFAVVGLVSALGGAVQLRLAVILLCSLMHELGHIFAMCLFGILPQSLTFYAGGIRLSENGLKCSPVRCAVILLAGCAVNFASAAVSILLGHRGLFAAVHLILGGFNLLPFRYFDGGRLYTELTGREPPRIIKLAALTPIAAVAAVSLTKGDIPLSLLATLAVILIDG